MTLSHPLATAILLATSLAGLVASATGPSNVRSPKPAFGEPSLEEVRGATERFRDVRVALAEGYLRDPNGVCETAPMMGHPAILIYEPQIDGSLAAGPFRTSSSLPRGRRPAIPIGPRSRSTHSSH